MEDVLRNIGCARGRMIVGGIILALAGSSTPVQAQEATQWDNAAWAIRRLPPSSFAQLPARVRRDLETRGCTIPQAFYPDRPHNAVSGTFTRAGRTDWAVLCSIRDSSRILVYASDTVKGP